MFLVMIVTKNIPPMLFFIIIFPLLITDPVITEVTNNPEHKVLMSIESEYYETQEQLFSLTIFKQNNPPRSANNPETHEITNNFFFAISDSDDYPRKSLFKIGAFYAPAIEDVITGDEHIEVIISYFEKTQKKFKTVVVGYHTVVFK